MSATLIWNQWALHTTCTIEATHVTLFCQEYVEIGYGQIFKNSAKWKFFFKPHPYQTAKRNANKITT
jgi:hypothetical protein